MATFSVKPTEGQDPWGATDLAWRASVESAVNASEVTIDKSAGIKVSVQDNAAGRKQLIYGDTGRRSIASLASNGWTIGYATLARRNSTVDLLLANVVGSAAVNDLLLTLPAGFRMTGSDAALRDYQDEGRSVDARVLAAGGITISSRPATQKTWHLTWQTADPWPVTLPGAAVGSIPNA